MGFAKSQQQISVCTCRRPRSRPAAWPGRSLWCERDWVTWRGHSWPPGRGVRGVSPRRDNAFPGTRFFDLKSASRASADARHDTSTACGCCRTWLSIFKVTASRRGFNPSRWCYANAKMQLDRWEIYLFTKQTKQLFANKQKTFHSIRRFARIVWAHGPRKCIPTARVWTHRRFALHFMVVLMTAAHTIKVMVGADKISRLVWNFTTSVDAARSGLDDTRAARCFPTLAICKLQLSKCCEPMLSLLSLTYSSKLPSGISWVMSIIWCDKLMPSKRTRLGCSHDAMTNASCK